MCVTQSAEDDTEIYVPGMFLDESAGAATEHPVSDGSTGRTSVRYYASHSAYLAPPTAGPNTTNLQSIDIGAICGAVGVETVAGVGTRYVGIQDAASAPKAILHFAVREAVAVAPTGVSHLGESESHETTSGSFNQGSFTWEHGPGGIARGVTVFVWTSGSTGESFATGVTYEGVAVPAVEGGEAIRTGAEAGNMKAFHLGVAVPTADPATVVVTRTNNAVVMWACCVTQLAGTDTEVYTPGMSVFNSGGAVVETSVHDGNPGSVSQRYGAGHFGYSDLPPAGANSTYVHDFDFGSMVAGVVRETVPGQGLRPVGFVESIFAPKAVVSLAVRQLVTIPLGDLSVFVYGASGGRSPIGLLWAVADVDQGRDARNAPSAGCHAQHQSQQSDDRHLYGLAGSCRSRSITRRNSIPIRRMSSRDRSRSACRPLTPRTTSPPIWRRCLRVSRPGITTSSFKQPARRAGRSPRRLRMSLPFRWRSAAVAAIVAGWLVVDERAP